MDLKEAYDCKLQNGFKLSRAGLVISKSLKDYVVSIEGFNDELVGLFEQDSRDYKTLGTSLVNCAPIYDDGARRNIQLEDELYYMSIIALVMRIAGLCGPDHSPSTAHLTGKSHLSTQRDFRETRPILNILSGDPPMA